MCHKHTVAASCGMQHRRQTQYTRTSSHNKTEGNKHNIFSFSCCQDQKSIPVCWGLWYTVFRERALLNVLCLCACLWFCETTFAGQNPTGSAVEKIQDSSLPWSPPFSCFLWRSAEPAPCSRLCDHLEHHSFSLCPPSPSASYAWMFIFPSFLLLWLFSWGLRPLKLVVNDADCVCVMAVYCMCYLAA